MVDKATQQQLNALKSQNQTQAQQLNSLKTQTQSQAQQIAQLSQAVQNIQQGLQARVQAEQALGAKTNQLRAELDDKVDTMKGSVKR